MKPIAALAGLFALIALPVAAQNFEEGRHYQRIGTPAATPDDRVQVIEAFAYPCPACRAFHPIVARWESNVPEHVEFSRLPIALQRGWDLFARAYYTAKVLGLGEDAHEAVFKVLHDERRAIRNFEDIAAIYADFGVETSTFINTSQSFAVESHMGRNRTDVARFGIRQTPTMVVQGKWLLSPGNFESYQQMLDAVDYLVAREAEALGLNGSAAEARQGDSEPEPETAGTASE
ncbi:MAG: thiol:disulfide interchange protein DsbA/DsbL [Wenzhouxiangella sp.]|nr:thiol:disulfide interchange protein DsbA/DsbL [Wenzhouxiangella sp.]MCH8477967.1 thiol:disulfide interchange protein DsbA/DsbL [Wenzhouxiangella sp.]